MSRINSELFKQKREDLGLTLRQVEEKTGVNRQTINNVERGIKLPLGDGLVKLMEFYKIKSSEIFLEESEVEGV